MRKRISNDTKKSLFNIVFGEGNSIKYAAQQLQISAGSARSIISRSKSDDKETLEPIIEVEKKKRGAPEKLTEEVVTIIDDIVTENPGATLERISCILRESHNILLSKSSVDNGLKKLKVTLKTSSKILDRVNSIESIEKRKEYATHFL